MQRTKEDLLAPLLEFEESLGFKLSQLLGKQAHKWVIYPEGIIVHEGIVAISETPQEAKFSQGLDDSPPTSTPPPTVFVSIMVVGEEFNYFNADLFTRNEMLQRCYFLEPIKGLWIRNSDEDQDKRQYYYFEPITQ